VFDLDQALQGGNYSALKPFGSLKLTTQKFYRINGGATQLRGVSPDISLPDVYSYLEQGEKDQDYPLPWDEIKPARYKAWSAAPNLATLKAKSQQRLSGNNSFAQITQQAQRMKKRMDQSQQSLKLTSYRAELKASKEESKKYEALEKSMPSLNVTPLAADLAQVQSDTIKVGRYTKFAKNIQKDIYVNEAANVIKDQF
jgi:carboxyl-terminal processing protease